MGTRRDPPQASPDVWWDRPDSTPKAKARVGRRHCWVRGTEDHPVPAPGLVIEWRKAGGGWIARVIYLQGETVIQRWVPAYDLRPADE